MLFAVLFAVINAFAMQNPAAAIGKAVRFVPEASEATAISAGTSIRPIEAAAAKALPKIDSGNQVNANGLKLSDALYLKHVLGLSDEKINKFTPEMFKELNDWIIKRETS